MENPKFQIGDEVVRSKGDYVVGRVGKIIELDMEKKRAKVSWGTWVLWTALEPTSIPYEIVQGKNFPKYIGK